MNTEYLCTMKVNKYFIGISVGGVCMVFLLTSLTNTTNKKDNPIEERKSFIRENLKANNKSNLPAGSSEVNLSDCPNQYIGDLPPKVKKLDMLSRNRSVRFKINPNRIYTETIVIMTPISNVQNQLGRYFSNLCRLTYPHSLISLALIEDSSHDDTYKVALKSLKAVQKHFAKVSLFSSKDYLEYKAPHLRHDMGWQFRRRSHLAKSRNWLLSRGLANETWVLWMDSDVQFIPSDLIEQLLAAEKDILVPSCMFRSGSKIDVYDKNTWKDTDASKKFLKDKGGNFLMLEGYGPPMRSYLNRLKRKGNVVEIDGVGGCVLLVRADLHRRGLVFPPYIYKNHIETEGLAQMAKDMGYKIYGLPNFEVYHE